jgi:hypothetical protein
MNCLAATVASQAEGGAEHASERVLARVSERAKATTRGLAVTDVAV